MTLAQRSGVHGAARQAACAALQARVREAGIEFPEQELRRYFEDPEGFVAALARLLTRHGNRVGAILYHPGAADARHRLAVIPPGLGRTQVLQLLARMRQPPPQAARSKAGSAAPTQLADLLGQAEGIVRRRSLLFVVSDFISDPGWAAPLGRLARRHEVLAVRLVDPLEMALPDIGLLTVEDAETGEQLLVDTQDAGFRARFETLAAQHEEALRDQLQDAGVDVLELATDEDLLEQEQVHDTDLFIALTNDDEDNIMAASLAKRLGCKRVLALINRRAYAELVQGTQIDVALSPAHTVIGELLAHVRRGDVEAVYSLRRGAAEALEAVARGDRKTSKVVGRRSDQIALPPGAQIGAIVRGAEPVGQGGPPPQPRVIIPHHDTVIERDDHVIVFVPHKRQVRDVEKLFQVGATFLF
jgi:Trk K+ transport system NAD-binding subunit